MAAAAGIGRSTLAALESGKLSELGFNKVARVCAAVDLTIDVRPPTLDAPLMAHRHLSELAGRELTKAAIDDIISNGDVNAWRGLVRALQDDDTGRLTRRVQDVLRARREHDPKARAFSLMLPRFKPKPAEDRSQRG